MIPYAFNRGFRKKLRYHRNKWKRLNQTDREPTLWELNEIAAWGQNHDQVYRWLRENPDVTAQEVIEALEFQKAVDV